MYFVKSFVGEYMKYGYIVIGVFTCAVLLIIGFLVTNKVAYAKNIRSFKYTAQQTVDSMGVGWNLGNTFDAAMAAKADETYWGQPVTTWEMISEIKNKGFKTIRIPVTWTYKTSGYPDYIIDKAWLDRVEEVVTYADEEDMYIIINAHHEGKNIIPTYAKQEECTRMLSCIWTQIADRFERFGNNLIFEVQNEPREEGSANEWTGGTAETKAVVNAYNEAAVEAIRDTGGNNIVRKIMIPGVAASSSENVIKAIKVPEDDNNIILSVHAYNPYDFAMKGTGTSVWGSDFDKREIDSFMNMLYNNYVSKGQPVIIGEFGATNKNNTESRIVHGEYFTSAARKCGITCVLWDNGVISPGEEAFGEFNREQLSWYFPEIVNAMLAGEAKYAKEVYVEGEDDDISPEPEATPESTQNPGTTEPDDNNSQGKTPESQSNTDIRGSSSAKEPTADPVQINNLSNSGNTDKSADKTDNNSGNKHSYKLITSKNKKVKLTGKRYILKNGKSYRI